MNRLIEKISFKGLAIFSILLLIPALLYHLSYTTIIGDECIRSLVAFEMLESGNFLVPTINGEYYYSKPPVYNWFIALSFYFFGEVNELSSRIPTIFFTILYGYIIYLFNAKHFGKKFGFLVAMMVITCGRILFWDSMLGLIDIGYSALVYTQIIIIYHYFKKDKLWTLFLLTYLLTAIGFLMKGYPSLVFQALSVGIWFIYNGKFKSLFSWKHISGILLLACIVGGYYYIYSFYNDVGSTVSPLLDQAMRRTVSRYDWMDAFQHLLVYPFENLYHFLPWSLFSILLLRKDIRSVLKKHPFILFNAMMFMVNIIVYWVSPEVYPRYVLMLAPLFFTVLLYLFKNENTIKWSKTTLRITFQFLTILLTIGTLALYFLRSSHEIPFYMVKIIALFIAMGIMAFLFYTLKEYQVIIFIIMMLIGRIGFNEFILYDRMVYGHNSFYKKEILRIADVIKDKDINIYKNSRIHFSDAYYLMSRRSQSMRRIHSDFQLDSYYILDTIKHDFDNMMKVDSFKTWEFDRTLYLVQPKD